MGSINCGVTVAEGSTKVLVGCDSGVSVKSGRMVEVEVTFEFRLSRPKVSTEPTTRISITPVKPPMTHGSQPAVFFTVSLKLDGTEIKITVVLSCPPRE